nr:DUF799 domain-containing protein [uncultured Desulfobulbus sp.]
MKPLCLFLFVLMAFTGCATPPPYDYSAFRQNQPRSILVLPPINQSPEIHAGHGVLAQVAMPLAESGYYVFPVTLVEETFINNGLTQPEDIHGVPLQKLHEIFAADAALYMVITEYGTKYMVLASDTRVTLEAKLIDLRTGQKLWEGRATASSAEQSGGNSGGLAGMLAQALVEQIINTMADVTYDMAGLADNRLLRAGRKNGLLYGPRSPHFGTESLEKK